MAAHGGRSAPRGRLVAIVRPVLEAGPLVAAAAAPATVGRSCSWPSSAAVHGAAIVRPPARSTKTPAIGGNWGYPFFDFAKVSSWQYRGRNSGGPEFWPEICPKNFF